jgi:hypothetical protein
MLRNRNLLVWLIQRKKTHKVMDSIWIDYSKTRLISKRFNVYVNRLIVYQHNLVVEKCGRMTYGMVFESNELHTRLLFIYESSVYRIETYESLRKTVISMRVGKIYMYIDIGLNTMAITYVDNWNYRVAWSNGESSALVIKGYDEFDYGHTRAEIPVIHIKRTDLADAWAKCYALLQHLKLT